MPQVARDDTAPGPAPQKVEYEQPLSERMRTFLRLEFLYQQTLYHSEAESDWGTRAAVSSLLEITSILTRGDVRSEVMKELERQVGILESYRSQPGVDKGRLRNLLDNLEQAREDVSRTSPHFLQPLKECEFLSSIKHRSAIPGGTCEFDLPDYSHWLRQPWERRIANLENWLKVIRPICDAVLELMWLIRESAIPQKQHASGGMYQDTIPKDSTCRLLRVSLPPGSPLYPEISGSPQRFTVRFMQWSDIDSRAVQTDRDVEFQLSIC